MQNQCTDSEISAPHLPQKNTERSHKSAHIYVGDRFCGNVRRIRVIYTGFGYTG